MTTTTTSPRGTTLVELITALPLLALLGVVAVHLTIAAHRRAMYVDGTLAASRELRQSANVLAVELRATRAVDLRSVRDTAIEFNSLVGTGIICASDAANRVALAIGTAADVWGLAWLQAPQPGDDVMLWRQPVADSAPVVMRAALSMLRHGVTCVGSPIAGSANGSSDVLELQSALAWQPAVGTPVRVTRRTRYSVYRATDGDWYLGRRTLGPLGWDVIQPVAGPLAAAAQRGLQFVAYSAAGARISVGDSLTPPARIGVVLRATRRVGTASVSGGSVDSLEVQIALRGDNGAAQ